VTTDSAAGQGDQLRPDLWHVPSAWPSSWASAAARRSSTSISTSSAIRALSPTWSAPASRREAQGYVETLFGRRLYLPDIKSRNASCAGAERSAINAPMQGTAADIIKRAMIAVDGWIRGKTDGSIHMLMQVHDELVFEVADVPP
jgi:hypothetical protein